MVWHLTRIQDDHLADAADTEQVWTSAGWAKQFALPFEESATGYGQTAQDVAALHVETPDLLTGYYDAVHGTTVRYVEGLTADDLARVVDRSWDPPVTLGVRLVSVLNDDLQHAGQAAFLRGIADRRRAAGSGSVGAGVDQAPSMTVSGVALDAPDAQELAAFYRRLLHWDVVTDEPEWVVLRPPGGGTGLSFKSEPGYAPPVWPTDPARQQMMLHLDIEVDDLAAAGAHAETAGAVPAGYQPQDDVRVYQDPAGHPFCLFLPR